MEKTVLSKQPKITIQNVVATGSLKHTVNLDAIVKAFPDVQYRPAVFPSLVFRLKRPKTATLIFTTGKMVCTGAKSDRAARGAIRKVISELEEAGIIITGKPEIKIQNIVATVNLGDIIIDLENFVYAAPEFVMYEPEAFPGAIYRMKDPKCVFLIFSTGKLVCVGATRKEDIYKAVEKMVTILEDTEVITRTEG